VPSNAELVLAAYDAFNRRDWDAVARLLHPEIVLQTTVETRHGHDGAVQWVREADDVLAGYAVTVEEVGDFGDRVLAITHQRGRGRDSGIAIRDSGIAIDQRVAHVWSVCDGRLIKMHAFTERPAALRCLDSQPMHDRK
jgi:ketosteroid isomerase-like protein